MPDLLEGDDLLPDEAPFGEVVVSLPQRHLTNQLAATTLMQFLTPLLTDGTLLHYRSFFDARRGYTRSDPVIDALHEVAL